MIFSVNKSNIYNILPTAGSRLGAKHLEESITKMSSENNHMFGKSFSENTRTKMNEAKAGKNNPMYGKISENNSTSKKIYNKDNIITLSYEFSSYTEAAKFFNCHRKTIYNFIDKNKYYKDK